MDRRVFLGMIPALPVMGMPVEAKTEEVDNTPWPPKFPKEPNIQRMTEEEFEVYKSYGRCPMDKQWDDHRKWYRVSYYFKLPKRFGGGKLVYEMIVNHDFFIPCTYKHLSSAWDCMDVAARQWYDGIKDWDKFVVDLKKV